MSLKHSPLRPLYVGVCVFIVLFLLSCLDSRHLLPTITDSKPTPGSVLPPKSAAVHHGATHSEASSKDILQDVFNETLGFQKIFAINLPSRTDHHDAITLAGALTGLKIDFIPGVTEFSEKTLPPGGMDWKNHGNAVKTWRAHLNAALAIVEQNLISALIMEADADWDLRIKDQMYDFAKASQLLLQPGKNESRMDVNDPLDGPPASSSPYGDVNSWDVLWLGHCGTKFPGSDEVSQNIPSGRVAITNDDTCPETQHLNMQFGNDDLKNEYANHTRVVSRAHVNVCMVAYAMSQAGARKFLYELGIHRLDTAVDIMFQDMCDARSGKRLHNCLTVNPQLFQMHRPAGKKSAWSDIGDFGEDENEFAFTRNIRWSTQLNFKKLIYGETDYIDLFRDGVEARAF